MISFYYLLLKQIVASKTHNQTSRELLICYILGVLDPHWHAPYHNVILGADILTKPGIDRAQEPWNVLTMNRH